MLASVILQLVFQANTVKIIDQLRYFNAVMLGFVWK